MNFSQLKARAATLCKLEGWTDTSPAPDWASLVQRGWDQFAWDAECIVASETTPSVIGQAEYALTGTYKNVLDVAYNALGLLRSEERFERNLSPNWRTQANGASVRWVLSGFSKLTLIPPPDAVHNIAVRGVALGAALSAEADIPAIPAVFHEGIALKAVVFHAESFAMGESRARMAGFEDMYQRYVKDCRDAILYGFERREPTE